MTSVRKWKSLTDTVRKVLQELPSSDERNELVKAIREIISVLEGLNGALGRLPTAEEAAKAENSLLKLDAVLSSNPLLRTSPRRSGGRARQPRKPTASGQATAYSKEILEKTIAHLGDTPEPSLHGELQDTEAYPNTLVRSLLAELGRRVPQKSTRSEMIGQLVVTIVNRRTYQGLRGGEGQR